jgi:hypothetical protein
MLQSNPKSAKATKTHNIKLPKQFRQRFTKPYDKFLTGLLTHTQSLTAEVINQSLLQQISGVSDWLVWLNAEDRAEFRRLKEGSMPNATNTRFVLALLLTSDGFESGKWHDTLPSERASGNGIYSSNLDKPRASYKINGNELCS